MRYHGSVFGNVFGLLLATVCACSTSGVLPSEQTVLGGEWGGVHAGLTLTAAGGAISYDCAHGGLAAPVRLNGAGRFEVAGVHVREHGGPVRVGDVPDSVPARYLGQVS